MEYAQGTATGMRIRNGEDAGHENSVEEEVGTVLKGQ